MCLTSLSRAKPNAIISTSGGNSMKKSVIGSRRTEVNSFSAMALNPRKTLNKGGLLLVSLRVGAGGQCHKDIFERRSDGAHICFGDAGAGQFLTNAFFSYGAID